MLLDVKNINKNQTTCPINDGSCETQITLYHCNFPEFMVSTKNKTLNISEWEGLEVDAKTKEVTDKADYTHYDLVTGIRYGTNISIDTCLSENAYLKQFIIDNTIGATNKKAVSFMNGFRFKIEVPTTDRVTQDVMNNSYAFKAILSGLSGLLGTDEESKNETELEFQLYGSPQVFGASNGIYYSDKKVPKVSFDVVAGTAPDSFKISNAVISNKATLCEVVDDLEVQYFASLKADASCDENKQMLMLNDWLPIKGIDQNFTKTIHVDMVPQESTDFLNVQVVDTTIDKVYAVVNLNGVATIVGIGKTTTTKTVK